MSSTVGYSGYASRSMNGINNVVDSQGNSLDEIAQKCTNISYDSNTDTTTIIQNTDLQTVSLDSITFPDSSVLTSAYVSIGTDVSFAIVDVSVNLTTAKLTFPDGTSQTTASAGYVLPTDVSFNNVDVSNNINTQRITFEDGTYFTSADYKAFFPADISLNSLYVRTDISCNGNVYVSGDVKAVDFVKGGNLWTEGNIVNTSRTATNVIGFPYSQNIYSFQYITGTPNIGDFVEENQPNMPTGIESGFRVSAYDASGALTFNSNSMSNTAQQYVAVNAYSPRPNEIWSYDFSAGLISLGSGIIMSGTTSAIQPFVNAYTAYFGSYYVATPLSNLTVSGNTVVSGYFKTANTIVSNNSFLASRYLTASTNIVPPTRVVSQSGKLITIESKNTITPSTSSGSITGVIVSPIQISYTSNTSSVGDFIGSGQQDGLTVLSIDTVNHLINVSNGTLSTSAVASGNIFGYVSAGNTIQTYDASPVSIGLHVNGLGVAFDYINAKTSTALSLQKNTATPASPVSSYYGYVDNTSQIITNGNIVGNLNFITQAALPVPTRITNQVGRFINITSPSAITNSTKNNFYAVQFGGNKLAYLSTVASVGNFVVSNYNQDVSAGCVINSIDTNANNQIMTLSQTNVPDNQPQFTVQGYISGTNKITLTSNTNVATQKYLYDYPSATTIPYGRNFVNYLDSSGCNIYNNTLTPTASSGSFYGYIATGGSGLATFITNDSFGTGATADFITGTGFAGTGFFCSNTAGVSKSLQCAGGVSATATTSTTITGFVWDISSILYVSAGSSAIGAFYQGTGIPVGTEQLLANDTTKQLLTVKSGLTKQNKENFILKGYGLSANTIQVYDTSAVVVNQFLRSSLTGDNKPYVSAINTTTKVATIGGTVSTTSASYTPTGYVLNATTLVLTNTAADSAAIANDTFITGSGLPQPTQVGAYNSTTNQYTIKSPNTISPSTALFIGYGVVISSVGYNILITNDTTARTNVCVNCPSLIDYGAIGTGTYQYAITYNTKTVASTINTYSGCFYEGFYITEPANALTTGGLITDASNPYTRYVFNTGRITTSGTGGKWGVSTGIGVVNSTPILSVNRQWIVASSTEIAYQIGATGTPAVNTLCYAQDSTYLTGLKITAVSNATYRVVQIAGQNFTLPTVATQYTTLGAGTNTTRINLSSSPLNVSVGQFIRIGSSGPIYGVKVSAKNVVGVFYVDVDTSVSYTTGTVIYFFNGNAGGFNMLTPTTTTFYEPSVLFIYTPTTYNIYVPTSLNFYNPITITNWGATTFTKYPSIQVGITAPAQYSSIVPLLYNEITSSEYSLYSASTFQTYSPVQINQWNSQIASFFNPQYINLIQRNDIQIPHTGNDTMCLLNANQSLSNKTITNSTLSGPNIVLNQGNDYIKAVNSAGTQEPFLWSRWSGDNGTYLNYGAGGFYLRSNNSTLMIDCNGSADTMKLYKNVYMPNISYAAITWSGNPANNTWALGGSITLGVGLYIFSGDVCCAAASSAQWVAAGIGTNNTGIVGTSTYVSRNANLLFQSNFSFGAGGSVMGIPYSYTTTYLTGNTTFYVYGGGSVNGTWIRCQITRIA